jgi:hypothetical protein
MLRIVSTSEKVSTKADQAQPSPHLPERRMNAATADLDSRMTQSVTTGAVIARPVLAGLHHDYRLAA